MKFEYEYRTRDNVRHTGVIAARDRESAFQILKGRGIRPGAMREAPGLWNRLSGHGKRWSVIVLLACAVGVLVVRQSNRSPVDNGNSPLPRAQIYGDSWVLRQMQRDGYGDVFESSADRFLAMYAIPGRAVSPMAVSTNVLDELRRTIDHDIVVAPSDLDEVKTLKRIVSGMKAELREYVRSGGTIEKYVRRLRIRQMTELEILKESRALLRRGANPEMWQRVNLRLRGLGLPMIEPDEMEPAVPSKKNSGNFNTGVDTGRYPVIT